jgi:hypothetical protein
VLGTQIESQSCNFDKSFLFDLVQLSFTLLLMGVVSQILALIEKIQGKFKTPSRLAGGNW